jgi:hypothetical protein
MERNDHCRVAGKDVNCKCVDLEKGAVSWRE